MHQYFLTDSDGKLVFELPLQNDRMNFLLNQYSRDHDTINIDLEYKFPTELEAGYSGHYLKLLPTYSGFKIAIRVKQKMVDNTVVYQPLIPLSPDFNIFIHLLKKGNELDSYTSSAFNNPISPAYFFSNELISGLKTFPYLTREVSGFDAVKSYSQGDLASFGGGDIREFYKDDLGDQWQPVAGSGFANENDRLLLPLKFFYVFNAVNGISKAEFILKDRNGVVIKTISRDISDHAQKVLLDFSDKAGLLFIPQTFSFPHIIYSLQIIADNGYINNHSIIFSDALYERTLWGMINIRPVTTNPAFNLFASDGFIIKRKNALGVWDEAPVFEIPVKSRSTYWRYINSKGKELDLVPELFGYLFKEGKILLTKKPRAISKSYFMLEKEGSTNIIYVPNPINYELKKDTKERLCFDITVPESELFPTI